MTYVLHYAPDNASLIVRLVLEELGVPYRTTLVDRAARQQDSAGYQAINPTRLIPALETPDGTIFETAAILLWLADTHGGMAPAPNAPERAEFLRTLFFISNTLHAQMRMTFYPWKYVGADPEAQAKLRTHLQSLSTTDMTIPNGLGLLDERYRFRSDDPGESPSVIDYYVGALLRWCSLYPIGANSWFDLQRYPALMAVVERLETRPALQIAAQAEGLGPTPFSAPQHPTPPEGSAL